MKTNNSYKFLIWTIVVLVILNLTTIGTIIYNRYRFSKQMSYAASRQRMNEKRSVQYSGRFFREKLNFSPEQMEKFSAYNPAFRQGVQKINFELVKKRNQMLRELSLNEVDTLKLNQLSDSIGVMHASLKKMTYRYYLDLKEICEPEQEKKLERMFMELLSGDGKMIQPGNAPQFGRQPGRKSRN